MAMIQLKSTHKPKCILTMGNTVRQTDSWNKLFQNIEASPKHNESFSFLRKVISKTKVIIWPLISLKISSNPIRKAIEYKKRLLKRQRVIIFSLPATA